MRHALRISSLAALLALAPGVAAAQTQITDLFNTGVDASGNVLSVGASDPHYVVLQAGGAQAAVTNNWAYAQTASSGYIWQDASGNPGNTTRTFRTTFTIGAGFDPLTASISGAWSTDNAGTNIFLNGIATGLTSPTYTGFTSFLISSGFVSGLNTLDFEVRDDGAPGALNVTDLQGTVRALPASSTVPEPTTVALLATGIAGVAVVGARRRRTA